MAQIVLSPRIREDFDRILEHLDQSAPEAAEDRVATITAAIDVLESSPMMGRPVEHGMRELVIGSGAAGYVALYRYVSERDAVIILAIGAQREAGYRGG